MTWLLAITTMSAFAQQATVTGPDSFLKVNVSVKQGIPVYSVTYKDKTILEDSPLGFIANVGDFSRDMTFTGQKENKIDKTYTQDREMPYRYRCFLRAWGKRGYKVRRRWHRSGVNHSICCLLRFH